MSTTWVQAAEGAAAAVAVMGSAVAAARWALHLARAWSRVEDMLSQEFGNGGHSLKDAAKAAAGAGVQVLERLDLLDVRLDRMDAKNAAVQLEHARDAATQGEVLALLRHDVTNVRQRTVLLTDAVEKLRRDRASDRAARAVDYKAWVEALRAQGIQAPPAPSGLIPVPAIPVSELIEEVLPE